MRELLAGLFSYPFIQRALIAGTLVALCSALLGVSLVLKRYSMIGDGLSHVGFGAMAVAMALGAAPLAVALPIVILAAFFLLRLSRSSHLAGDSAIALVSSAALAIGVVATSLSSGSNVDVMNYLFGSILTLTRADVILSVSLSAVVILLFVLFKNRIFAVTFDEPFAKSAGVRVGLYNGLLALLIAVTVVVGMRIVGTMLISSLIIFPALGAMQLAGSFRGVVLLSALISVVSFLCGLLFAVTLPAGATIVLCNLAALLLCTVLGKVIKH